MRFVLPQLAAAQPLDASRHVASAAIHVGILALALARTAWTAMPSGSPPDLFPVRYAALPQADPAPRRAPARASGLSHPVSTMPHFPVIDIPVPPANVLVASVPEGTPPPAPDGMAIPRREDSDVLRGPTPGDRPLDARAVDKVVEPRAGNPVPRYPPALEAAGVSGAVTVRFIVDTLGAVEKSSIQVLRSTHVLFEQSVHDALTRMRFIPAEAGDKRVRQLVEQTFQFEMRR